MWRRIATLIGKEFLAIWKDRRSRMTVIVPPLIQLLVFGYAATFDVRHVATAVFNEDGGAAARELIARFEGSPTFDVQRRLDNIDEIATVLDPKDVLLVVHVGPTFSRDLLAGRPAPLQVAVDGRQSNTALVVLGYVNRVVAEFNEEWAQARGLPPLPAQLVTRAWYNANLESRWFFLPGIVALLTLVVTIVLTALTVAREREMGTFEQLLVTPLRPIEILVGKSVPALVIGFFEGSVIVAVAVWWFEVPMRGSLPLLYASLFVYLMAVVGFGLMVSSLVRTQQQAILGAFLFVVPAVILSGFATPVANMPKVVQDITLINPMRYFLVIVRRIFLEAMPPETVAGQLLPMAVIAVVNLAVATWLFRHRLA